MNELVVLGAVFAVAMALTFRFLKDGGHEQLGPMELHEWQREAMKWGRRSGQREQRGRRRADLGLNPD